MKRIPFTIYHIQENGKLFLIAECFGKEEANKILKRYEKEYPGENFIVR